MRGLRPHVCRGGSSDAPHRYDIRARPSAPKVSPPKNGAIRLSRLPDEAVTLNDVVPVVGLPARSIADTGLVFVVASPNVQAGELMSWHVLDAIPERASDAAQVIATA